MKTFISTGNNHLKTTQKLVMILLIFAVVFSLTVKQTLAQVVVTGGVTTVETASMPTTSATVKQTIWQKLGKILQKAGSIAYQKTLSTALNKIAYDAANYIGSGNEGQKSLYINKGLGDYLTQIGDEAAGTFLESFVNNLGGADTSYTDCSKTYQTCITDCSNTRLKAGLDNQAAASNYNICVSGCNSSSTACASRNANNKGNTAAALSASPSFNVCQPTSLEAKLKISLGLVQQSRPQGPNCTASEMVKNWSEDIAQKYEDMQDPEFLDKWVNILDPSANDLGIYFLARADLYNYKTDLGTGKLNDALMNKGWTNAVDVAGNLIGIPGQAERQANMVTDVQAGNIGKITGDVLVDAANVFLNQLGISAYNRLMQNLGKKTASSNSAASESYTYEGQVQYGEVDVKEVTSELLKTQFGTQTNYDILSELSVCSDNKNPRSTDCVIDSKFMQGISEQKTVMEAVTSGLLHGDWQLTATGDADSYSKEYSLRNISILRKYRILPVGWEVAINKIAAENKQREALNQSRLAQDKIPLLKVTLMDLISCFDSLDTYNQFSSGFDTRNQGWCEGLIDPNWVLKAPQSYCKKEGVGAQILNKIVIPGTSAQDGVAATAGELSIVRADDYCADEQSCIKEKSDGSCEAYGYCNEERRTWNFGADSCEPTYNTCQSFVNPTGGQTVSYLKNTLDYGDCDPESAGCRQYSLFGAYSASAGTVSWDAGKSLYFNKNLSSCNNKDEGCTELMRVKPTWGSNLVMNTDFSDPRDIIGASTTSTMLNDWPLLAGTSQAVIIDAAQEPGGRSGRALKIVVNGAAGGVYSSVSHSLLPANFQIIPGQSYTLSADVYLTAGTAASSAVSLYLGADTSEGFVKTATTAGSWQHISVTRLATSAYNDPNFGITANATFYLKSLKFEVSDWDKGYGSYGSFKIYEKLIPPYLEKSCYLDAVSATKNYNLKSDAPAVCSNYARKCNKEEVGCELYTSSKDNLAIPAKVTSSDYCSGECLGYDVYIAKANYFNPLQIENLIPAKSATCSAAAVGCNEFTNLDTLAQGGEQKEYYTSLKQCIKSSTTDCASFYSWEGTEAGYQLKSYSLKKNLSDSLPAVTSDDSAQCNAVIYNLPTGDPAFNADCREFYNAAGQVSYHLNSRTITCSDNCHAYRMSEKNVDSGLNTAGVCAAASGYWNASTNTCNVCFDGGVWNTTHNACIYQAIPGEGQTCSANENGCREYSGNRGNNIRLVAVNDFETGLNGWYSNCSGGVSVSTVANSNNGHSLQYHNNVSCGAAIGDKDSFYTRRPLIEQILASGDTAAQLKVGANVTSGSAYTLKFMARAADDVALQIYFLNKDTGISVTAPFSGVTIKGGNEWNLYQANLTDLNHPVSANETLIITAASATTATSDFFLDNFTLTEITDRYYLIRNSSQIPDICSYDIFDNYQGAEYNLGCSQYTDRDNLKHNLRKFSKLCADSAVGCEQMIDTKNYDSYGTGIWNDDNNNSVEDTTDGNGICDSGESGCLTVAGDSTLYAVYDASKQCNAVDLGCSRLGQGEGGASITGWSDVFKLNNPNKYDQLLCSQDNVGCEEWKNTEDSSKSYFKDPGSNVCRYRASQDPKISGKFWYKLPVKRCDADNNGQINDTEKGSIICTSDSVCGTHKCIIDNNDYPCSVSYFKTIGLGGAGNQVSTPDRDAGLCEAAASGCTEYIDPVSHFAPNLVDNPGYQTTVSAADNIPHEGWGTAGVTWKGQPIDDYSQIIKIERNKLYSLTTAPNGTGGSVNGAVIMNFLTGVKPLLADNNLGTTTNILELLNGTNQPIIFYSLNNSQALLSGGNINKIIEIKELAVNYQLQANIDKKSCNGLVKFDNGCILFNERSVNGVSGVTNLNSSWDAAATTDGAAPTLCDSSRAGSCTANQLIKVKPDRSCAKWLDCVTYGFDSAGKKVCYALGECSQLNDKNECGNFLNSSEATHTFSAAADKNSSGYALVDRYHLGVMKEVGVNTDAHFDFENADISLSCRKHDSANNLENNTPCSYDQSLNTDTLVLGPDKAPTDYPAHGRGYLKVPGNFAISPQAESSYVRVYTNQDYYINYLVNTKNSGMKAKVVIMANDSPTGKVFASTTSFTEEAVNGWERRVHKFNISTTGKRAERHIKILLTSENGGEKDVYFDDVNIEPVLKINNSSDESQNYIAKDCRLYPTTDSLTCTSYNNNVVADGLYGYCLQYDPLNPGVCAMWYPIDKISSVSTSASSLGYNGKFPLYYCTEANGDFQLVKKVKATWIGSGKGADNATTNVNCIYGVCPDQWRENSDSQGECGKSDMPDNDHTDNQWRLISNVATTTAFCGDGKGYNILMTRLHGNGSPDNYYFDSYCVPKEDEGTAIIPGTRINSDDYTKDVNSSLVDDSGCANDVSFLKEAWVPFNGILAKMDQLANDGGEKVADYIDEVANNNPPIAIYEPGMNQESDLKFVNSSDPDEVYRIQCNRFTQLVNGSGDNKAWADRVSRNSTSTYITPSFFNVFGDYTSRLNIRVGTSSNFIGYGRNREAVPYGAAVLPSGFNLSDQTAIYLGNQYSRKNNETTLAGRPYGCSYDSSKPWPYPGCFNIGQCSLNPNAYCIYSSVNDPTASNFSATTTAMYNINQRSCAGGSSGTCLPLWTSPLTTASTTDIHVFDTNILKTLFWHQYSQYQYLASQGSYQAVTDSSDIFNWDNSEPINCKDNVRTNPDLFCNVWPTVTLVNPADGHISAPNGGVYKLTFTTQIDKEQQPLKQIVIDWGDGNIQTIIGEDSRPSASDPHVFYHYYLKKDAGYGIQIKVIDNWEKFGCAGGICEF